jgi:hypothetical protein
MQTKVILARLALALTVVALPSAARAQAGPEQPAPGRISGLVVSAEGAPVASAAITVRNAADSVIVSGGMSDESGRFVIDALPLGAYLVRISHLGFQPRNAPVVTLTAAAPAADLGGLQLETAVLQIDGVSADAARSAVVLEADRTVYDARQMPQSAGTTVDVLRAVPELEVDVNGRVALRGNQAVAIHINGRPAPLRGDALSTFLSQLPGDRVSKVEVMPNPSAKQDPEGMGGIVNIVLRENLDLGLSGSLGISTSSRLQHGASGRINYQRGRLTLFTGASLNTGSNDGSGVDFRQNLLAQPVTRLEQTFTQHTTNIFAGMDLTTELRVGRQATLWGSLWYHDSSNDDERRSEYTLLGGERDVIERFDRDQASEFGYGSAAASFGFRQVFEPQRHEVTVDVRRSSSRNGMASHLTRHSLILDGAAVAVPDEATVTDSDEENTELSVQADYVRPWGQRGRISVGARVAVRALDNVNAYDLYSDAAARTATVATRTGYVHDETFRSAYTTVSQSAGRFSVQLGLRAELAATAFSVPQESLAFDNDYNSLFQSVNLSWDLQRGRTARLSYSRRIGRPHAGILNPTMPQADPLNRYFGNPYLRPNYTHSFGGDVSWVGQAGTLRVAPYYRRTTDNWDQFRTVDSLGVSTLTWANIASVTSYGSTLTFAIRPTGKVNGSMSLNGYREVRDAGNIDDEFSRSALRWSMNGTIGYALQPALTATASANYMPPRELVQGRMSAMFMSSIGIQQRLWGTRGTLSMFVQDPLDAYRMKFETSDRSHTQNSTTRAKMRQASIRLTYAFGRPPQQNSRQQGADEAAPSTIR